jgi:hypothetical protein
METTEAERTLEDLETRIERLRALYEQYFLGIEKIEPQIPRKDVDRRIYVLRREQIRNTAMRFKFQMLIQRYNTLQQYWHRITREIENGTYRRDVMRAAARFGEKEALTVLGKKRQKMYARLAEAQGGGKPAGADGDDEGELLDADDLIEDEGEPVEDVEAATDGQRPVPAVSVPAAGPSTGVRDVAPTALIPEPPTSPSQTSHRGLLWGEQPAAAAAERVPAARAQASAQPAAPARAAEPAVDPAKRRVAALAAEMKAARENANAAGSFGDIDLNLDMDLDRASAPGAASQPAPTRGALDSRRPQPRRPSSRSMRAVKPPGAAAARSPSVAPAPGAAATSQVRSAAASVTPHPERSAPVQPATPRSPDPRPPPARVEPAAGSPSPDGLPEQRLRQIYAKYVETKRAAHESTAGVTFEKLASSLRAQTAKLRASHPAKTVDYEVVVKDGKTTLKPVLR